MSAQAAAAAAEKSTQTQRHELEIRRARRTDMSTIAAFIRSSADWYAEFLDEKDLDEHYVDEAWEERNYGLREFYVGATEGEDVGTISLQTFGDAFYLGYIYLDASQVGKGFGGRLIRFAEAEARRRGVRELVLICHPQANWAVRAYQKFGFERIASNREEILQWQDGALVPHYEEGFELYSYKVPRAHRRERAA